MEALSICAGVLVFLVARYAHAWANHHRMHPGVLLPVVRPHRCTDFDTTRANDGVERRWDCYQKEARRGRFCGEDWPDAKDALPLAAMAAVMHGECHAVGAGSGHPDWGWAERAKAMQYLSGLHHRARL